MSFARTVIKFFSSKNGESPTVKKNQKPQPTDQKSAANDMLAATQKTPEIAIPSKDRPSVRTPSSAILCKSYPGSPAPVQKSMKKYLKRDTLDLNTLPVSNENIEESTANDIAKEKLTQSAPPEVNIADIKPTSPIEIPKKAGESFIASEDSDQEKETFFVGNYRDYGKSENKTWGRFYLLHRHNEILAGKSENEEQDQEQATASPGGTFIRKMQ